MRKTQYKIASIFLGFICFIFSSLYYVNLKTHSDAAMLIQEAKQRQNKLLSTTLQAFTKNINEWCYDYTYWDDMVEFVRNPNPTWASRNIEASTITYDISVAWVFDSEFNQKYGYQNLSENETSGSFIKKEELMRVIDQNWFSNFYIINKGRIFEINTAPIQPSLDIERKTEPKGWLIIGRIYKGKLIEDIKYITNSDIKIIFPDKIKSFEESSSLLRAGVYTYTPLTDMNKNTIAFLTSFHIDKATEKFITSAQNSFPFIAVISLLFFVIVYVFLLKIVVGPIKILSSSLFGEDETKLGPLLLKKNEFGALSKMMERFFIQKRHLETEIKMRTETEIELKEIQANLEHLVEIRTSELLDATKLMQTERDQANLYLEMAGAVICLLDENANVLLINKMGYDILGYEEGTLIGKNWVDFCYNENTERNFTARFKAVMNGSEDTSVDNIFSLLTKKHDERKLLVNSCVTKNPFNGKKAVLLSGVDITPLKKSEEALQKLSRTVEQSPAMIIITDLNGDIEYVNPKYTEVSGYTFADVKGQNPRILKSQDKSQDYYKEMWDVLLSGKEWRDEFYNEKKNGELYWASATISPIINNFGAITNFIILKEDITTQKRMTEELISSKEKAEEMNRVKSYFYANMSHELRTPFVGILGYAELLSESLLDDDQREMANEILRSSRRLTDTLNKVLNITKLEFDKIETRLVNTDVFQMIKNIQNLFVVSAEQKATVIKTEFLCDPFIFKTDDKLLYEVLTNLINNAIKFTTNGVITISAEKKTNNRLSIKVADTGVGIQKEKQQIIWQEFRQASEGLNRSFEGTGLGLTIVRKYTEMLGGQVFVESEAGKGSVFTIELPIIIDPQHEIQIPVCDNTIDKYQSPAINELRPKILYVEDDAVSSEFVNLVLSKNYDIVTTPEAEKVLILINETQYDILLVDINLGRGMDGVELTQLIRQNPNYKNVPVIALTAYASDSDKEEFMSKGFSHYLSKPFTITQLREKIKIALN